MFLLDPLPVEENIEIFYEDGIFQFRFDTVRGDWDYYEVNSYDVMIVIFYEVNIIKYFICKSLN